MEAFKVWLWDMKHKTSTQQSLGRTEEKEEQGANWEFVCMCSPTLELGKGEWQLPIVRWVLELAESTERERSASQMQKVATHLGRKVAVFTGIKQTK